MQANTLANCQTYIVNLKETLQRIKNFLIVDKRSFLYHCNTQLQDRTEEVLKNLIYLSDSRDLPTADLQSNLSTKKIWKLLTPELQDLAFQIEDPKVQSMFLKYCSECREYAYSLKDLLHYQSFKPTKGFDFGEGTTYEITITLDDDEANSLANRGMALMGFKALQSTPTKGTNPTIWFSTQTFGQTITLTWTEKYMVYTSKQSGDAVRIKATNKYEMDRGDVFTINSNLGTGTVTTPDKPQPHFTIDGQDKLDTPLITGLMQADPLDSKKMNVICAIPMGPHEKVYVAPVQTVYLIFSTEVKETGSVVYRDVTRPFRIDLTDSPTREVGYKNGNWTWSGEKWAGPLKDSDSPFIRPLDR